MRIMFLCELYSPHIGGMERMTEYLVRGLVARGHEPFIITNLTTIAPEPISEWEGVPLYRLPTSSALIRKDVAMLAQVTARIQALRRRHRPDLVHVQVNGPMGLLNVMTNRTPRLPTTVEPHSSLQRMQSRQALSRVFGEADAIVTLSSVMEQDIRQDYPHVTTLMRRIVYGTPFPTLAPAPLPFAPPVLLAYGRIVHEKGFDLTLDAFAQLRGRYPALRLIIAGDGAERPALEAQAAALGVSDGVEFTGWVAAEDVPALINRATVVTLPSRCEDVSPVVVREAAQMARPVVAADVGGVAEVVQHRQTGLLFAREDSAALADTVHSLLKQPEIAREMGTAARAYAQEAFGLDRYVEAHLALYQELIEQAAQTGRTWEDA